MIDLLLAAAVASAMPNAIDAERAFAANSQKIGQWTAFRKYAAEDAVMFIPQAVWVHEFLKQRADPPPGLKWWPTISFISCDGRTAVNSGPWIKGDKHGYFTTVWQFDGKVWRWLYDGGDGLEGPPPLPTTEPRAAVASCEKAPGAPVIGLQKLTKREAMKTPEDRGRGESADKSLGWDWKVDPKGARYLRVFLWNGERYAQVLHNDVKAQ